MCDCVTKLFLFVLNFVIFALGVAVVSLASIILAKGNEFQQLFTEGDVSVPIVILIAGICVLLIGFFGCCGAMKESPCLLQTYAGIVIVLLVMEIVGGIMVLANFDGVKKGVKTSMEKAFSDYSQNNATDNAIDAFQEEFHCCGIDSYNDWRNTTFGHNENVPDSCCKDKEPGCGVGVLKDPAEKIEETIYNDGCYENFIEGLESVNKGLGIAAIILALVQLVCIIGACSLARKAKKGEFA